YDGARGEPRGPRARGRERGGRGDCVDGGICVPVCPTGIDIRAGLQYECIGCAACIDGCDQVMDKMGTPRGLIRYSTQHALDNQLGAREMWRRVFRPRVLLYSAVLWAIIIAAVLALYVRVPLKVDIIRDRAAIAREVEGGLIENVYRVQLMNTQETPRRFVLRAEGLPSLALVGEPVLEVDGAAARLVPVRLRVQPAEVPAGKHPITLVVQAADDASVAVREKTIFIVR
ncbi:MAG: FixG Ig-like domain-containing protein, partial [Burkholderiales bacterium]|nr:FixG Ig-like domain-containing protein [Burkholderiales bacterium]